MANRLLAVLLVTLMVSSVFVTAASAKPNVEKEPQLAARVRAAVVKLGTGSSARIEIKLIDGIRLKRYVSESAQDHIVIVNDKTGAATAVPYPQVKTGKGKQSLDRCKDRDWRSGRYRGAGVDRLVRARLVALNPRLRF